MAIENWLQISPSISYVWVTSAMEDLIGLGNAGSNINVMIQVLSEPKSQKDDRLQ